MRAPRAVKPTGRLQQTNAGRPGKTAPRTLQVPPSPALTIRDYSVRGSAWPVTSAPTIHVNPLLHSTKMRQWSSSQPMDKQHSEEEENGSLLLLIDFKKSCDTLFWNFMKQTLDFSLWFLYLWQCLKILYANITSAVNQGGHKKCINYLSEFKFFIFLDKTYFKWLTPCLCTC